MTELLNLNVPISEDVPTEQILQLAYSMFDNKDVETGLSMDWITIREKLCNGVSVGEVLPLIFDYYEHNNEKMNSWMNYLLSCSHFTKEELDGTHNRSSRRQLEMKVKKLMKMRKQNTSQNINQFLYNNKDI